MRKFLAILADSPSAEVREYMLAYVARELFDGLCYELLFELLDDLEYKQAKIQFDPSTTLYAQDLDLGRQAAASEGWPLEQGLFYLPYLWRYTLLRGGLTSQVDHLPTELFQALLMLGKEREVLELANLLTERQEQVRVVLLVAQFFVNTKTQWKEGQQLFLKAYEIASSIEIIARKADTFCELLGALTSSQQGELADRVSKEAIEFTSLIERTNGKSWVQEKLARTFAEGQQWDLAEQTAYSIEEKDERVTALCTLTKALAGAEQWERAERIALSIEKNYEKARAFNALVRACFKAQRRKVAETLWLEARKIARSIEEKGQKATALSELGCVLAEAQEQSIAEKLWNEAQDAASLIDDSNRKDHVLSTLASTFAEAQRWEKAVEIVNSIKDGLEKASALCDLGKAFAKTKQWENAENITHFLKGSLFSNEKFDVLCAIASSLAEEQQWERAEKLWLEALQTAHSIIFNRRKSEALSTLACDLASAQRKELAERACQKARECAFKGTEMKFPWFKASDPGYKYGREWIVQVLARAFAKAQQWEQAEQMAFSLGEGKERDESLQEIAYALAEARLWERCERIVLSIESSEVKVSTLPRLASAFTRAQQRDRAERLWREAQKNALSISIEEGSDQARALQALTTALIEAGLWKRARKIINSFSPYDEEWDEKASALSELASAYIKAQQWGRAFQIIPSIKVLEKRADTLERFADAIAKAQQWKQARRVLREVERLLDAFEEFIKRKTPPRRSHPGWVSVGSLGPEFHFQEAWRGRMLAKIAATFELMREWETASELIDLIMELDVYTKDSAMRELVEFYAESQQWERAEEFLSSIEKEDPKSMAMCYLARSLVRAQQWERAEKTALSIASSAEKAKMLHELAGAYAEAQQWEKAKEMVSFIQQVSDEHERAQQKKTGPIYLGSIGSKKEEALHAIAIALAKARHWEQAEQVAYSINETWREKALLELMDILITNSRYEQALSLVQRSWLAAETSADARNNFSLVEGLIICRPDLGMRFHEVFQWVDANLGYT